MKGGAKRTHIFQIIVTLFIFNIKNYVSTKTTCNKCSFDYLHWLLNYGKLYRKDGVLITSDDVMFIMSDEAHFHLYGYVNKKNCRFLAAENPRELHQRPLHTAKVSVWCGISTVGIAGPYFFWRRGYSNSDIRALCRDATQFSASTTSKFTG